MKKMYFIGGIILAVLVALVTFWVMFLAPAASDQSPDEPAAAQEISPYKTVFPLLKEDGVSATVLGTVISNEIANVYPRREGIVKDVLVDIGDHVRAGQVLAVLLPPGVEGQSTALIGEKQAYVTRAQAGLKTTEAQTQFDVESVQKDVSEKSIALSNAQKNKHIIVREATVALETTQKNEEAKKALARQELDSARQHITQLLDQAQVSASDARRLVELTLVSRSTRRSQTELLRADIPSEFGATNGTIVDQLIEKFNSKQWSMSAGTEESPEARVQRAMNQLNDAKSMLDLLRAVLRATVTSDTLSPEGLTGMIKDLNENQTNLLEVRQDLQDGINDLRERERRIGEVDSEAEKNIEAARKQLEKTKALQESDLRSLEAEHQLLQKQLELKKQEQQQMIQSARSDLQVANSSLSLEYATSGNARITSPFEGVISQRFLQVGESAMSSQVAFELSGVVTTLSKKAKREIEFGLPDNLNTPLIVGDTIHFFIPGSEQRSYEAAVTRKSPKINDASRTFTVRAKLDDSLEIAHNTVVRVRLNMDKQTPVFSVPSIALVREDDRNYLWELLEDNSLRRLEVNVLNGEGEFSDITGELSSDMRIVIDPVTLTTPDHAE